MKIDKVVLIAGASTGFGRLTSLELARRGYRVLGAFRGSRGGFESQAEDLAARASALGLSVESVQMDVRDGRSVDRGVAEVVERAGRIDVLINAAGYGLLGPFESTTMEQVKDLYETNVFGTMRLTASVLPIMRQQRTGTVINFSSDVGVRANFFQTAYASSKYAVEGFSESLRLEVQQFGIRVIVVNPGWYDTEFGESVVLTFGDGRSAAAYEALVAERNKGVDRVEGPNDRPQDVAELIGDALEDDNPNFRYVVGWNPDRMGGIDLQSVDDSQRRLFDYYGLDSFRFERAER